MSISLPVPGRQTLSAEAYFSPAIATLERSRVHASHWHLIGHVSQVASVGDHLVCEVAGTPLLIVRGADGVIRALHNVCRHRAGPLALCDGRGARQLRCRYHGWTYTLEGQLRSAPEMPQDCGFSLSEYALPRASISEWHGLLWVHLQPTPQHALVDVLAGLQERMAGRDFSSYRRAERVSYDIDCNWKVYVDNFLEGYHLPHVHPGLNALLDYRAYRTETSAFWSLQHAPLEGDGPYAAGTAWYWFIYPSTMLNVLPGRLQTNRVIPLAAERCRVEFDFYYPDPVDPQSVRADRDFSDEVQREDIDICVQVQRGLASGSYHSGPLHPLRETGLLHFQDLWRADLAEA